MQPYSEKSVCCSLLLAEPVTPHPRCLSYDGVRYGARSDAAELNAMYRSSRNEGLGAEVKRRILMGTYALSSGYYDAYYKRAQQVIIQALVRTVNTNI